MKPLQRLPLFRRKDAADVPAREEHALGGLGLDRAVAVVSPAPAAEIALPPVEPVGSSIRALPRPALRWVGPLGKIALREFDFATDSDAVCSFQKETYTLNFPEFRYTESFAAAFKHDLRRATSDCHHGLFVLDEGEITGFSWLVICENSWTGERYGYVNNVYVTPSRRGQGLGRELLKQAETFFTSRRVHRVRLTVTNSNEAAAKLYAGCDYKVTRWEMEKDL